MQSNMELNAQLEAELAKDVAMQDAGLIASLKKQLGIMGGRRHKGSKKAHKGKRHGNASLRAWVTFVKKVQKEEGIGYKEAMSVAKKRKDGGEKWRGGAGFEPDEEEGDKYTAPAQDVPVGGRRRRRRTHKRRGSKRHSKRRGTRRHRR